MSLSYVELYKNQFRGEWQEQTHWNLILMDKKESGITQHSF
jgi:hypothetical protein